MASQPGGLKGSIGCTRSSQRLNRFNDEVRLMDRYEASVLNKITEKSGPVATIAAIIAMKRWTIPVSGIGVGGTVMAIGSALRWW